MKPLDQGKCGDEVMCSMYATAGTAQTPPIQRKGHCPYRWYVGAILGDKLLDSLAKGVGRLGVDLKQEGVHAKNITN